ncbi:hypothetical protein VNO80_28653 [Phaseolus coccineus]|uniref:Uncharacterized protein n=1 Tax=Phaseolus coccineus TaxID=3886 RepID=A0AAN9QBN8_PHACN
MGKRLNGEEELRRRNWHPIGKISFLWILAKRCAKNYHTLWCGGFEDCLGAKLLLIHFRLLLRVSHLSSLRFIVIPPTELSC